mgnify:CR=1 FL=1
MDFNEIIGLDEFEIELGGEDRWYAIDGSTGTVAVAEFVNNGELRLLIGAELIEFGARFGAEVAEFVAEMRQSQWEDGVIDSQLH